MEFKCTCHNSGTNSFSGKCSNCGMTKPSKGVNVSNNSEPYKTVHQNKSELEQFYSAEKFEYKEEDYWIKQINNLDRFTHLENGEILEDLDGEYVLFSDVLKVVSILFSAQKR